MEKIKNFGQSFLYGKADYGKEITEYIIKSDRIDKESKEFDNIKYVIQRNQVTSYLVNFLDKKALVLMMPQKPMPLSFRVFTAKDIRTDGQTKVFVDCYGLFKMVNGEYTISTANIDVFIAYLLAAMNAIIYSAKPTLITNNTELLSTSTECFAKLFTNIIDYMRIGGVDNVREKTLYLSALYYQIGILLKDDTATVYQKALKISGLSSREADMLRVKVPISSYDNINTFITILAQVLNVEGQLKLDNFIEKWCFLYKGGTHFATELYPAFANMLIYSYIGSYIVNQKTIEKILGRSMVDFCKALFYIGGEVL